MQNGQVDNRFETDILLGHGQNVSNSVHVCPGGSLSPWLKNKIMFPLHRFWHNLIDIFTNNVIFGKTKYLSDVLRHIMDDSHVVLFDMGLKNSAEVFIHDHVYFELLIFQYFYSLIADQGKPVFTFHKIIGKLWTEPDVDLINAEYLHQGVAEWELIVPLLNVGLNLLLDNDLISDILFNCLDVRWAFA